jgi:SEC-C motif-containing protein
MKAFVMCYCGNTQIFEKCCQPYLMGRDWPLTAEILMRSRYSAYCVQDIDYLKKTSLGPAAENFDEQGTRDWARQSKWKGLKILSTQQGLQNDQIGQVEFVALYELEGQVHPHHELSIFKRDRWGHWMFYEGQSPQTE